MKKIYITLVVIICSLWHFQTLAASDTTQITLQAEQPDKGELPEKGHRKPSAQFICTIDFNNHSIVTAIPDDIISFELWDENGTYLIASYDSDSEFVDFLSGLSGAYQLRLVGEDHVYIGFLEL